MNVFKRSAVALCAAALSLGTVTAIAASAADPHTYESLGVDKDAKVAFETKTAAKTRLPVINITTTGNKEMILSKEVYTDCVVDVFNAGKEFEMDEVSAGIKVRGNSSAYYGDVEKIKRNPVPYRIKFDKKQNMLGLNDGAKCKSWVLLKTDWNICANDIAFRMGREIFDDTAFVSDAQYVHLYVNDKLQGLYLLCEQSQVNEYRVNVSEAPDGYTGTDIGYYLELDNYADREEDNIYFTMDYEGAKVTDVRGVSREFVPADYSIKNDIYSEEQKAFIDKYLNNVFKILYNATEKGVYYTFDANFDLIPSDYTTAEETVSAVMDMDSVVDMYLLYEIVHDYDCGEGSFYMCVDFAEGSNTPKLQFTSPWDFNWAYNDSTTRYWAGAFCTNSFANQYGDRSNPWLILLAKQDWFHDLCADKWAAERENVRKAVQTERDILAKYEKDINVKEQYGTSSASNLLDWVDKRLTWMDATFEKEHNYVATVKTAATCTESGVMEYKCACGDKYTEEIPALGHDYKDTVVAPTATSDGYTLHTCTRCKKSYMDSKVPKITAPTDQSKSVESCTATLAKTKCVYKGKGVAPKLTLKDGSKTLVKGTDYKLSYKNYVKPGKATITITGIGSYTGKRTLNYYIVPKQNVIGSVTSKTAGKITTSWTKDTLATGYRLQFASDKSFKSIVKTAYAKKNSTVKGTVSGLTSGKTYYVRVTSYKAIDGKRYYGPVRAVKSVKVK